MRVIVNGQEKLVAEGASVQQILDEMKLSPDRVAVEVNRRLLRTARYGEPLKDGDQVEIVTFVGGG